MPRRDTDPYGAYHFLIEIDGVETAAFSDVSGLGAEIDVVEYREGSDKGGIRKLPGLTRYTNVSLKRGVTRSQELWDWFNETSQGNGDRRSVAIILLDESRQPALRWELTNAWPCQFKVGALDASSSDIAIETLELAYEGLDRSV